jgi:hypothetical protein
MYLATDWTSRRSSTWGVSSATGAMDDVSFPMTTGNDDSGLDHDLIAIGGGEDDEEKKCGV